MSRARRALTQRAADLLGARMAGGPERLGRGGRPLRVAYGRIFHEANTYSPVTATQGDFTRMHHVCDEALHEATSLEGKELAGYMAHAELSGFRQAAAMAGDVETVPLSSSLAVPGGPLTRECFDWLLSELLGRLEQAGPLDGVYLALHGSMEVEGLAESPEGVILERAREIVGEEARIAVSYDLHANFAAPLIDPVDILVAYRTNPHWDLAPTGFRAGNRLIRALRGQCAPVHAWRKLPMVLGGGMTIDFLAPMRGVFRAMRRLEDDPRVLSASLFMVHPYTSADNLGWAAHVCTDGDPDLAARLAEELADLAWAQREAPLPALLSAKEAIDATRESRLGKLGPVTWVDVDDIVGAGAPGGNTQLVKALAESAAPPRAYVPVHDPRLVEQLWSAPLESLHHVTLRGTPGYHQPEVPLTARVAARHDSDFGRLVRLDVLRGDTGDAIASQADSGGVSREAQGTGAEPRDAGARHEQTLFHVAISDQGPLPISPRFWRELGLDPRRAEVLVQKNFFHYRMFYSHISFSHLPVVSGGATSLERVRQGPYAIPMYPASNPSDWREGDRALRKLLGRRVRQQAKPLPTENVSAEGAA